MVGAGRVESRTFTPPLGGRGSTETLDRRARPGCSCDRYQSDGCCGARPRFGSNVSCRDLVAAVGANEAESTVSARLVDENDGWSALVGDPSITPAHQGGEYREQLEPSVGQHVLVPLGMVLVRLPLKDSMSDEALQAVGQHVAGEAYVCLEVIEPANPPKRFSQDEGCPPFADDLEGSGDGAGHVRKARSAHAVKAITSSCIIQPTAALSSAPPRKSGS